MEPGSLTERESEIKALAVAGLTNEQIADRLAISRRTVEAHMRTVLRKVGVRRRSQLAGPDVGPDERPDAAAGGGQRTGGDRAAVERRLRSYAEAVEALIDRQFPLFEEQVELTLTVGEDDRGDTVVERRRTRPTPYLVYRVVQPIANREIERGPVDDLQLACDVYGADTQVDLHVIDRSPTRQLVVVFFQPGLQEETEWALRYRSPALWAPLRASGEDTLTWAAATLDQRHRPTVTRLVVRLVFPRDWSSPILTERDGRGAVRTERLPDGRAQLSWEDTASVAPVYTWRLQRPPE